MSLILIILHYCIVIYFQGFNEPARVMNLQGSQKVPRHVSNGRLRNQDWFKLQGTPYACYTAKTEVLEMRFTAYFWAKCSHYQWHFLYLDFSVLKRRVTISF